jgi:hypothetical protein
MGPQQTALKNGKVSLTPLEFRGFTFYGTLAPNVKIFCSSFPKGTIMLFLSKEKTYTSAVFC